MEVRLDVTAGPHAGKSFTFDRHDTFLVGRSKDAHFQLAHDDPYFSRRHFVVEVNPPRVRVLDLKSRNGTHVNGNRVATAELNDGDTIKAGHTIITITVPQPGPDDIHTFVEPTAGWLATQTHSGSAPAADIPGDADTIAAVPGYRLGAELGRGAMGIVYRAVRLSDNTPAAVKTIKPTAGADHKAVDRFVREARLLGGLRHPNVVGFLDAGEAGEQLFIAMELIEGTDAGKLLKAKGKLAVPVAVRLVCQALAGLGAAHNAGIVHRDVKPANLLVGKSADGKRVVKVADFGLARAYEESQLSGVTMQGDVGGTPVYMAPEQVTHYRARSRPSTSTRPRRRSTTC